VTTNFIKIERYIFNFLAILNFVVSIMKVKTTLKETRFNLLTIRIGWLNENGKKSIYVLNSIVLKTKSGSYL